MEGYIRKAKPEDIEKIAAIFESGRQYLEDQGLGQWQHGNCPTRANAEADIKAGHGYVLIVSGEVAGYASLIPEPDGSPDLSEGQYIERDSPYAAIHSVAIDKARRGRGLSRQFMRDMLTVAGVLGYQDIRIDTHPDNVIMRKIIDQVGFSHRGTMHFPYPDGERRAYQIILD